MRYLKTVSEFLKEDFRFRGSGVVKDFNSISMTPSQVDSGSPFVEDGENDLELDGGSDEEVVCDKEITDPDEIAAAVQKDHLEPLQQFISN